MRLDNTNQSIDKVIDRIACVEVRYLAHPKSLAPT